MKSQQERKDYIFSAIESIDSYSNDQFETLKTLGISLSKKELLQFLRSFFNTYKKNNLFSYNFFLTKNDFFKVSFEKSYISITNDGDIVFEGDKISLDNVEDSKVYVSSALWTDLFFTVEDIRFHLIIRPQIVVEDTSKELEESVC